MPVTRFPNGVTNVSQQHIMGDLIIPDPSSVNYWYLDFNTWYPDGLAAVFEAGSVLEEPTNLTPWQNHLTGASDILPTTATGQSQRGGRVSFVTGAVSGNVSLLRTTMAPFVVGGRDLWFETTIRGRTDVTTLTILTGISNQIGQTPNAGLFFTTQANQQNGELDIFIKMRQGGVETFSEYVGRMDMTNTSDTVLGFHWDNSQQTLRWTINNQYQNSSPAAVGNFAGGVIPGGAHHGIMRVQTDSDDPVTVDWDDIFVAQSRNPSGGYT